MKRLRKILFGVAALFASLLALANRSFVTVSFDPIPPRSEAWSIEAPLFLVILAAMFCGILIGGFAVWLEQRRSASGAAEIIVEPTPGRIMSGMD